MFLSLKEQINVLSIQLSGALNPAVHQDGDGLQPRPPLFKKHLELDVQF